MIVDFLVFSEKIFVDKSLLHFHLNERFDNFWEILWVFVVDEQIEFGALVSWVQTVFFSATESTPLENEIKFLPVARNGSTSDFFDFFQNLCNLAQVIYQLHLWAGDVLHKVFWCELFVFVREQGVDASFCESSVFFDCLVLAQVSFLDRSNIEIDYSLCDRLFIDDNQLELCERRKICLEVCCEIVSSLFGLHVENLDWRNFEEVLVFTAIKIVRVNWDGAWHDFLTHSSATT